MGKLSATQIKAIKEPGRYHDGDGLMLVVSSKNSASWLLRVQAGGRRREFGLGSLRNVSLAEARDAAAAVRKQFKRGADPVAEKRLAARRIPTFREAAVQAHKERRRGWKSGKHQAQWLATLEAHAFPTLGQLHVNAIDGSTIRDVLLPIWLEIPETARRVRQRIGAVLDWSFANGFRDTEAPMRAISSTLPKQPSRDGHFAAMPYADVPGFLAQLRAAAPSFGRMALEAAILTTTRSGEVRGARWAEIDFENALWTIPAERMKARKAHIVPLSGAALAVFRAAAEVRRAGCDFVFQGIAPKRPMSDMTLLKVLRDMELTITVHGFRSSFRDWVAESMTTIVIGTAPEEQRANAGDVAEAALAHDLPSRVEAAYRRTKFLDHRRKLMDLWANYLARTAADVIAFPGRKSRSGK